MEKFWPACLSRFEEELSAQQFNTWIKPLKTEFTDKIFTVVAPNKFVQQWVKDRFLNKIERIAEEILSHQVLIKIIASNQPVAKKTPVSAVIRDAAIPSLPQKTKAVSPKKEVAPSGLNPSFNFDNYVTGRANQLARAAAIQVA